MRHRARYNSSLAPRLDAAYEAVQHALAAMQTNAMYPLADREPQLRMLASALEIELPDVPGSKYARRGASGSRPEAYLTGLLAAAETALTLPAPVVAPPPERPARAPRRRRPSAIERGVAEAEAELAADREKKKNWEANRPYTSEQLANVMSMFKPTAMRKLSAIRQGKAKGLKGYGDYQGVRYVSDGYWALPGYIGPTNMENYRLTSGDRTSYFGELPIDKVWPGSRGMKEIFVTFVPGRESKEAQTTASHKMAVNVDYFALAVFAVGPQVRLFQQNNDPLAPIIVQGSKGEALIMPMRA
jgi:hypothetical protein